MHKKLIIFIMLLLVILSPVLTAKTTVTTIDFLKETGVNINAAGPLLMTIDSTRNRIIVANTLSSGISVIDGKTHAVQNIPIDGRALQHLKSEALTISKKTGNIYLIGANCFFIISPATKSSKTIKTPVQFESIAVDETYENVFIAGRGSKYLGFYNARSKKLKMIKWLDKQESLKNLNQTPPPPIRKVIPDNELKQIIAVDGYTSTLYRFKAKNGKLLKSRSLNLQTGGRWHLAGYNETTHCLYLVIETDKRNVIQAGKINIKNDDDIIIKLPEYREGVGINYNSKRDEIYIPYDNNASVHIVDFRAEGDVKEVLIPTFGNDASAIDYHNDLLYIASWPHGEIDVIDLKKREFQKLIPGLGIIPHMFTILFNPHNNLIYFPKGATAVNGTFGAAISVLNPQSEECTKIYTGWAPADLIELPHRNSFLVFNNEDQFAEVKSNSVFELHRLPFDYPIQAIRNQKGNIYLSYGPHQSYWPNVYIWSAKNGILTIDKHSLDVYDRRIPRQAQQMTIDKNEILYFTQNNWGSEEQFLGLLPDDVRFFDPANNFNLNDTVTRETSQRILKYDAESNKLYLVRLGEQNDDLSILQILNPDSNKVEKRLETGLTATDLVFDKDNIYISDFGSNTVTVVDKNNYQEQQIQTQEGPLKLSILNSEVYVINHLGNSLQNISENGKIFPLPIDGFPDNIFNWNNKLIIISHTPKMLHIFSFDPKTGSFSVLHQYDYPFGDTRLDSDNASFYVRGQFGDAIFSINRAKIDKNGRLWLIDFLAGKLFIIDDK